VGGNLSIESLQDTDHFDSKQLSGWVSVSVCVPPVCAGSSSASASMSREKMRSDFGSVTEQSGMRAGSHGFEITVKGNTDLKGGVIASDADASKNTLSTGTLTFSDIENRASTVHRAWG
jgi:filamentous hemagglutinin